MRLDATFPTPIFLPLIAFVRSFSLWATSSFSPAGQRGGLDRIGCLPLATGYFGDGARARAGAGQVVRARGVMHAALRSCAVLDEALARRCGDPPQIDVWCRSCSIVIVDVRVGCGVDDVRSGASWMRAGVRGAPRRGLWMERSCV
ncbi:hypothetical protein C8J57DRAFT_1363476 [Mycena rebaudengoi]|nr:hypothetical protein C8J57DRAFT_1363476 [Mycena rebaudengoi]